MGATIQGRVPLIWAYQQSLGEAVAMKPSKTHEALSDHGHGSMAISEAAGKCSQKNHFEHGQSLGVTVGCKGPCQRPPDES
eukprot:scaffold42704_cov18-Tisochrysis_lutea.AAC.1